MDREKTKRKPGVLTDLELDEISLVDAPANPYARVLITKREFGEAEDAAEAAEAHMLVEKALSGDASRQDVEVALTALARSAMQPGETVEKAMARILETSAGRRLYQRYVEAAPRIGVAKASVGATAWDSIERAAKQLMERHPELSKAKAVDMVLQQRPELYARHEAEYRAAIAGRPALE